MLTFKQFLSESLPSPNNVDQSFNVGNVAFDNKNGLGATPMGGNTEYLGAVAWIKPSVFRQLAHAADRSDTAKELEAMMRKEEAIAAPFLVLDILDEPDDLKEVKVITHEGRARADAFKAINGDVPMPVQLHFGGLRARHLSPEFFKWIEKHGIVAEKSSRTVRPNATKYYWMGKEISGD